MGHERDEVNRIRSASDARNSKSFQKGGWYPLPVGGNWDCFERRDVHVDYRYPVFKDESIQLATAWFKHQGRYYVSRGEGLIINHPVSTWSTRCEYFWFVKIGAGRKKPSSGYLLRGRTSYESNSADAAIASSRADHTGRPYMYMLTLGNLVTCSANCVLTIMMETGIGRCALKCGRDYLSPDVYQGFLSLFDLMLQHLSEDTSPRTMIMD